MTIEYELARLRERGLAWLLDWLAVLLIYFIVRLLALVWLLWLHQNPLELVEEQQIGWGTVWKLLIFLFYFSYHILFEIWNIGQTPGKMIMGIKVVRLDGKDPEWSDVVLRTLLHLADSIFSICVIGMVLIKTTDKSQRLGDMAANTTVIKIRGRHYQFRLLDILNISTLDNYQPVYPQVRKLSEQDMIFIKTTLNRLQRYPNPAHEAVVEDLVTHLMPLLNIEQRPANRVDFLKTLLRDYIVLTR